VFVCLYTNRKGPFNRINVINGVSVIDSGNRSVHRSAPGNAGRQGRNKQLNPCASTAGKPHKPLGVLKSRRRQT
jgi:hypothetical protein